VLKPRSEDGEYEGRRFAHWLADLHRYNIQAVLIERYEEVPEILAELNRRSHLRDIFISGSADDFSPLGEATFYELCRSLGAELIKNGFNIISGFGLGVGDAVIIGAMQALPRNDEERLQLWPFPQQVPAGTDRAALWRRYREQMISNAGVCIVLAGNKREGGTVVPADGVRQEVEIALSQGKLVIPVGATGHVAGELWDQCRAKPTDFVGEAAVSGQLSVLGDPAAGVPAWVNAMIDTLRQLDR
jgi:Sir2- and TIR-associating SLOG family